jgi:hypothetical protein
VDNGKWYSVWKTVVQRARVRGAKVNNKGPGLAKGPGRKGKVNRARARVSKLQRGLKKRRRKKAAKLFFLDSLLQESFFE